MTGTTWLLIADVLAGGPSSDVVVKDFHDALARSPDTAVAVAAIKVSQLRACTRAHPIRAIILQSCASPMIVHA